MDEHRLGLKPVLRRVWGRRGERPSAPVHHRYRWLYLYGFVRPGTGQVLWYLMPTVSAATFGQVLAAFAADAGVGPTKEVLLVLDGAGWHVAKDLAVPVHLHLAFLPAYSPELQPAERLWPLADEAVANRCFDGLAELGAALEPHCLALARRPEAVRGRTLFSWWPHAQPAEQISRI
jgi:DDE superfamily endonuclease